MANYVVGQALLPDNIPDLTYVSFTEVDMPATNAGNPTRMTVGGVQYTLTGLLTLTPYNGSTGLVGLGGIDTGSILSSATVVGTYYLYAAVDSLGNFGLICSLNNKSIGPTGMIAYKQIGSLTSNLTVSPNNGLANPIAIGAHPPGTIAPFAGKVPPPGWLLCDGSPVSQTAYPALYAAIGNLWDGSYNFVSGSTPGSPGVGLFRLPALGATHLRGAGQRPGGLASLAVGSCFLDSNKGHSHNATGLTNSSSSVSGETSPSQLTGTIGSDGAHGHTFSPSAPISSAGAGTWVNTGGGAGQVVSIVSSSGSHTHSILGLSAKGQLISTATADAQTISGTTAIDGSSLETTVASQGVNYIIKY